MASGAGLDDSRRRTEHARREAEEALRDARHHVETARLHLDDARAGLAALRDVLRAAEAAVQAMLEFVDDEPARTDDPWREAQHAQARVEADFVRRFERDAGTPFRRP